MSGTIGTNGTSSKNKGLSCFIDWDTTGTERDKMTNRRTLSQLSQTCPKIKSYETLANTGCPNCPTCPTIKTANLKATGQKHDQTTRQAARG